MLDAFSPPGLTLEGTLNVYFAINASLVDFVFVSASLWTCLESQYDTTLMATVIEYDPILRVSTEQNGGLALALASRTDISSIEDIAGQTVIMGNLFASLLTAQAQAYELVDTHGSVGALWNLPDFIMVDTLGTASLEHLFIPLANVNEEADVMFVSPRALTDNSTNPMNRRVGVDLQIVDARNYPGFPRTVSTKLFPNFAFGALSMTPDGLSSLVGQALLNLTAADPAAVSASITGFRFPLTYVDTTNTITVRRIGALFPSPNGFSALEGRSSHRAAPCLSLASPPLQKWLGVASANNGTCQQTAAYIGSIDVYSMISCPDGMRLQSRDVISQSCSAFNSGTSRDCPGGGLTCICKPCVRCAGVLRTALALVPVLFVIACSRQWPPCFLACAIPPCRVPDQEFTVSVALVTQDGIVPNSTVVCQYLIQCYSLNQQQTAVVTVTDNYGPALRALLGDPISRIRYKFAIEVGLVFWHPGCPLFFLFFYVFRR